LVVGQFVSRHRISGVRGEGLKTMPPILPIFPNRATGVARTPRLSDIRTTDDGNFGDGHSALIVGQKVEMARGKQGSLA